MAPTPECTGLKHLLQRIGRDVASWLRYVREAHQRTVQSVPPEEHEHGEDGGPVVHVCALGYVT